jgi:solute carrier family 44 (choline transporter-like protein), member 1
MLISCLIALGTASLYLVFLRYCGCFTVFLSTVGIEGILAYASYRLLQASADPLSFPNDPAMKSSIQITAVIVCCSAVLFLLLAFNMLPRLLLAGTFITHASKALHQLKRLLVVPFISFAMLLLLFWWAILVTICIFGAGATTMRVATVAAAAPSSIQIETESFEINYHLRWFFFYHVWGVYWTAMWILSIGEMITATATAMWYFAPDDKVTGLKTLPFGGGRSPVSYAFRSSFRFHLGTLALSAAVVTPISYVRAFFAYLEDKNEYDSNVVTTTLARCCCVRHVTEGSLLWEWLRLTHGSFCSCSAASGALTTASSLCRRKRATLRRSRARISIHRPRYALCIHGLSIIKEPLYLTTASTVDSSRMY